VSTRAPRVGTLAGTLDEPVSAEDQKSNYWRHDAERSHEHEP
jgi:hypothetical protein